MEEYKYPVELLKPRWTRNILDFPENKCDVRVDFTKYANLHSNFAAYQSTFKIYRLTEYSFLDEYPKV